MNKDTDLPNSILTRVGSRSCPSFIQFVYPFENIQIKKGEYDEKIGDLPK